MHLEGGVRGTVFATLLAVVFTGRHVFGLNVTNTRVLIRGNEATVGTGKLTRSRLNDFLINMFSGGCHSS